MSVLLYDCVLLDAARETTTELGTKLGVEIAIRQQQAENGNKRVGVIPGSDFGPSSGVTVVTYHRIPEHQVLVTVRFSDGSIKQWIADTD